MTTTNGDGMTALMITPEEAATLERAVNLAVAANHREEMDTDYEATNSILMELLMKLRGVGVSHHDQ